MDSEILSLVDREGHSLNHSIFPFPSPFLTLFNRGVLSSSTPLLAGVTLSGRYSLYSATLASSLDLLLPPLSLH